MLFTFPRLSSCLFGLLYLRIILADRKVIHFFFWLFRFLGFIVFLDNSLELFRSELLKYIHQTIQRILSQVPTGLSAFAKALDDFYPHKRFSIHIQTEYIQQLLAVADYLPLLRVRILEMIVQRCLEMDVEIVIEDDGEVRLQKDYEAHNNHNNNNNNNNNQTEEDDTTADLFSAAGSSFPGLSSSYMMSNAEKISYYNNNSTNGNIPTEVIELADKLDSMLSLVIHYLQKLVSESPTSSCGMTVEEERFYSQFLEVFERRLLPTHKSKYVQFVFFSLAGLRPQSFGEMFARKLFEIVMNVNESNYLRQSAVMYLASYLSRAAFLSLPFIR
jgi:RNA polymerase I-specific transcription initiation factor RRN3